MEAKINSPGVDGLNSFISVEPYSRQVNPGAVTPPGAGPLGGNRASGLCFKFNKKEGCTIKNCRFKHACSYKDKSKGNAWACMDTGHNLINHK